MEGCWGGDLCGENCEGGGERGGCMWDVGGGYV